jgi:hypothetical protein
LPESLLPQPATSRPSVITTTREGRIGTRR